MKYVLGDRGGGFLETCEKRTATEELKDETETVVPMGYETRPRVV
jgi:hypothetical protein